MQEVQKLQPNSLDDWLPLTASRNGNTFSTVFHIVTSGIGIQALFLPVGFATLGWTWGIICLLTAFAWQIYTIWLLVHLAEPVPGTRYSRYMHVAKAAFGPKLAKSLCVFPVWYLSGGTCIMLIITAGADLETLYKIMCGGIATCEAKSLPGVVWCLLFICIAIVVSQLLPNLNSVLKFSKTGTVTAVVYVTLLWALTIRKGHNLVLEIQGTLPSSKFNPSSQKMWRAVKISYMTIGMCSFPLALTGYWAYGNKVTAKEGLLSVFSQVHGHDTSRGAMGSIYLLQIINCLCQFQIYAMPAFDSLEFRYIFKKQQQCPRRVLAAYRFFFTGLISLLSVAFPFFPSLAPFMGGLTLPFKFSYPCLMYNLIKKPDQSGTLWWLNLGLGCFGIILSVMLVVATFWNLVTKGVHANFFSP
ncbi:lysine histidine transporter-like 7 [Citrus sinensis]|nr:lysine histidine transporter-like 7 [Citrus sinensis]